MLLALAMSIATAGQGAWLPTGGHLLWVKPDGSLDGSGGGIGTRAPIRAIAALTSTTWLATDTTAVFNDGDTWNEFDVPAGVSPTSITALDERRAVIARGDELVLVDKDKHAEVVASGHGKLGRVAPDGKGGAWILTADGLAHWPDWHVDKTSYLEIELVHGSLVGATDHEVTDGSWRVDIGEPGAHTIAITHDVRDIAVLAALDDELIVYRTHLGSAKVTREHVDVPRWWRKLHGAGRAINAAVLIYDPGVFVATDDIVLYGHGDDWHTFPTAASPEEGNEDAYAPFRPLYSFGLQPGYAIRSGTASGGSAVVRPEIIGVRNVERAATGIGGYLELGTADGAPRESWLGGGVTVVRYGRSRWQDTFPKAVALSAGAAVPFAGGHRIEPELSLFAGIRSHNYGAHADGPVGLRLDARIDAHGQPSTITLSFEGDLIGGVSSLLAISLARHGD